MAHLFAREKVNDLVLVFNPAIKDRTALFACKSVLVREDNRRHIVLDVSYLGTKCATDYKITKEGNLFLFQYVVFDVLDIGKVIKISKDEFLNNYSLLEELSK